MFDPVIIAANTGSWLWDKFGETLLKKTGGEAQKRWEKLNWKKAAEDYRAHLITQHDKLLILGKPKPASLEGVFTDVYLLDQPSAYRRFDLRALREDSAMLEKAERIKGKVISAMVYPVVVLTMALGILAFLMIVIVPKFQDIFKEIPEHLRKQRDHFASRPAKAARASWRWSPPMALQRAVLPS